jgi:hypothetical protein
MALFAINHKRFIYCGTTAVYFLAVMVSFGCSFNEPTHTAAPEGAANIPRAESSPIPVTTPSANSSIRNIDFSNFTFPAKPIYSTGRKHFTLRNGRYEGRYREVYPERFPLGLTGVVFGDITSDGVEGAMVILSESVKGTAIPYYVYLYTIEKGTPKLLWAFETGDRGDGGLRKVYAENGELFVELYGKDTTIGDIADKDEDAPACCPKHFTLSRYEWRGGRFQPKGALEVLPNPLPNAELLSR